MVHPKNEGHSIVRRRLWALILFLAALFGVFCYVLYDLQIVHGADYREQSRYKIPQTETVDASRGEILDTLGRVLVTNRVTYQVTLDTSLMGTTQQRNATLLELLEISREQETEWADTLPITTEAPFSYTRDDPFFTTSVNEDGEETKSLTRLGKLALSMKWISDPTAKDTDTELPSARELLELMCGSFALEGGATAENRAVAGVLYELYLRAKDITWSSYVFAEDVDITFISVVKERGLPGVQFEAATVRQYNTTYAAHILGRVGSIYSEEWATYQALGYSMDATVGKDGLEKAFEEYLCGTAGTRILETNTEGKVVSETWKEDPETGEVLSPEPGYNVVSTLNIRLQEVVERSLAERVAELEGAEGAAAVVLNVNDAGVLAMASYPTYDITNYSAYLDDDLAPLLNRAIQGLYPPGSTFKMVTAIGALEEEIITSTTKIQDTGKYMYYAPSYTPSCWIYRQNGGSHGLLNVTQAITESCNVFFYDVGRRLGIDKLNEYAYMFGLGQKTGIELEGEKSGVVAGRDYTENVLHSAWYDGSTLAVAIGQENNQYTPLQLANYIATLVNGGNHYATHLLKEVKSADYSEVIYTYEPELLNTIDIDPENLDAVKQGMLALTETGSVSKYFQDVDVKVGAKTGSAQVSAESNSNAVFVAFAPYDDPEIALCIVVEKGGSGSELAAIAADIISYYFSSEEALGSAQAENSLIR